MQGYYQQPSYPYDQNYYYQQQQQQYSDKLQAWLEQIRLTNPQAYEWYKNYYSGMLQKPQIPLQPTMDDLGGSLRSGYNSGSERYLKCIIRLLLPLIARDMAEVFLLTQNLIMIFTFSYTFVHFVHEFLSFLLSFLLFFHNFRVKFFMF